MNLLGKWLMRTAVKINLELFLYGIKGLKSKVPSPHRMGQKWHGTRQILKRSPFTVSPDPSYMLLSESFFSKIIFTVSSCSPISHGPAWFTWTSTIPIFPFSSFSPLQSSLTGPWLSPALPQQSPSYMVPFHPKAALPPFPLECKLPILLDPT